MVEISTIDNTTVQKIYNGLDDNMNISVNVYDSEHESDEFDIEDNEYVFNVIESDRYNDFENWFIDCVDWIRNYIEEADLKDSFYNLNDWQEYEGRIIVKVEPEQVVARGVPEDTSDSDSSSYSRTCDIRCKSATSDKSECECVCGGDNHGSQSTLSEYGSPRSRDDDVTVIKPNNTEDDTEYNQSSLDGLVLCANCEKLMVVTSSDCCAVDKGTPISNYYGLDDYEFNDDYNWIPLCDDCYDNGCK